MIVDAPEHIPLGLRPGLWLARRITGKDPLPARLLAHAPKAVRYARALTNTPVHVDAALANALRQTFSAREIVVLAATIAQVNTWARFNHGLGVPAAGFFDEAMCTVPLPPAPHSRREGSA